MLKLLRKKTARIAENDIVLKIFQLLDSKQVLSGLTEKQLASELLMSSRTLNRRLAAVQMNYRAVIEKYKLEKALLLMEAPDINMTEIAFQLGFSDLSAFSRAFKRWTGCSPRATLSHIRQ